MSLPQDHCKLALEGHWGPGHRRRGRGGPPSPPQGVAVPGVGGPVVGGQGSRAVGPRRHDQGSSILFSLKLRFYQFYYTFKLRIKYEIKTSDRPDLYRLYGGVVWNSASNLDFRTWGSTQMQKYQNLTAKFGLNNLTNEGVRCYFKKKKCIFVVQPL